MKNLNFLIVDDHKIIRETLIQILRNRYPDCQVSEAADEAAAVQKIKKENFQLVILDVHMPGSDALGLTEYLHAAFPLCPVIVFSMHEQRVYEERFLQAGARAYVSKATGGAELAKAIDTVLRGRKYISPDQWLESSGRPQKKINLKPFEKLSAREFQIALLLLHGQTVSEISSRLCIHSSTTGTHKAHIFNKVGAKNLADFIQIARLHNVGE